jgi:hypothetical protein
MGGSLVGRYPDAGLPGRGITVSSNGEIVVGLGLALAGEWGSAVRDTRPATLRPIQQIGRARP